MLHGKLPQDVREAALRDFKAGKNKVLVRARQRQQPTFARHPRSARPARLDSRGAVPAWYSAVRGTAPIPRTIRTDHRNYSQQPRIKEEPVHCSVHCSRGAADHDRRGGARPAHQQPAARCELRYAAQHRELRPPRRAHRPQRQARPSPHAHAHRPLTTPSRARATGRVRSRSTHVAAHDTLAAGNEGNAYSLLLGTEVSRAEVQAAAPGSGITGNRDRTLAPQLLACAAVGAS